MLPRAYFCRLIRKVEIRIARTFEAPRRTSFQEISDVANMSRAKHVCGSVNLSRCRKLSMQATAFTRLARCSVPFSAQCITRYVPGSAVRSREIYRMLRRLIDTERIPKWAETSRHKLLRPPPRPLYIGPAIAEIFGLLSSPDTGAVWRPEPFDGAGKTLQRLQTGGEPLFTLVPAGLFYVEAPRIAGRCASYPGARLC